VWSPFLWVSYVGIGAAAGVCTAEFELGLRGQFGTARRWGCGCVFVGEVCLLGSV
jgi:hypothetical protein